MLIAWFPYKNTRNAANGGATCEQIGIYTVLSMVAPPMNKQGGKVVCRALTVITYIPKMLTRLMFSSLLDYSLI